MRPYPIVFAVLLAICEQVGAADAGRIASTHSTRQPPESVQNTAERRYSTLAA